MRASGRLRSPRLLIAALVCGSFAIQACGHDRHDDPANAPSVAPAPDDAHAQAIRASFTAASRFAPFFAPTGEPLDGFDVVRPPAVDAPERSCLQGSTLAYRVELANGTTAIHPTAALSSQRDPLPEGVLVDERLDWPDDTERRVFPVDGGYLVALTAHDRAGEVWFVAPNTAPKMILAGSIVDLVNTPAGWVAAVGQGYITSEHGALFLLAPGPKGLEARRLANLGEVPRAVFADRDGTVLIVTPRALLRLDPAAADPFPQLVHRGQWLALRPTSVVREASGTIYLGIRHGVVRLVPSGIGYREDWLLPRACPETAADACSCLGRNGDRDAVARRVDAGKDRRAAGAQGGPSAP